nr:hypothetical protein GCM10020185_15450 [Pseudomonas brassicacearum subsp. brassicacearum]
MDFLPVERVLQIGSAKGVARLMQRAGRSGHAPGRTSRVTLVPTHSLELIEAAAAQDAVAQRRIEPRESPHKPLDVLVQHLVSMALGGGFVPDELFEEVRGAWAYRDLNPAEWAWALAFVRHGGLSLTAYPDYRRVEPDEHGIWRVPDARLARRHRMSIGTIVSDASLQLKFWSKGGGGKILGSVEEGFIARLRPGDGFLFAGRLLELVRVEDMTAYVRRSQARKAAVPRWNGGRMPLSSELAAAVVARLSEAAAGRFEGPEMHAVQPLLLTQQRWSGLPTQSTLLAEALKSREGWHLFLYPFAGRQVHLGLASLLAWRVSRQQPLTFFHCGQRLRPGTAQCHGSGLVAIPDPGPAERRSSADRRAREPECRGIGPQALSRNRPDRRAGLRRLPRCAEKHPASPGVQRVVLPGVQAIRRQQSLAGPGWGGSLARRIGYPSTGADLATPQYLEAGPARDQAPHPARVCAAGGAIPGKHEFGKSSPTASGGWSANWKKTADRGDA